MGRRSITKDLLFSVDISWSISLLKKLKLHKPTARSTISAVAVEIQFRRFPLVYFIHANQDLLTVEDSSGL